MGQKDKTTSLLGGTVPSDSHEGTPVAAPVNPPCGLCGGPHPYDTSVPSILWNAVVRVRALPEYLCLTCIVRIFAQSGESFTAELIGAEWASSIEVRVLSRS